MYADASPIAANIIAGSGEPIDQREDILSFIGIIGGDRRGIGGIGVSRSSQQRGRGESG
jgi:hypothetical protein